MKIGDKITKQIKITEIGSTVIKRIEKQGTVVYIHPKNLFYVLEFEFPKGKYRESYGVINYENQT